MLKYFKHSSLHVAKKLSGYPQHGETTTKPQMSTESLLELLKGVSKTERVLILMKQLVEEHNWISNNTYAKSI